MCKKPGVVPHTFNPSPQEAETGGFLGVPIQPGIHSEFLISQDYIDPVSEKYKLQENIPSLGKMRTQRCYVKHVTELVLNLG